MVIGEVVVDISTTSGHFKCASKMSFPGMVQRNQCGSFSRGWLARPKGEVVQQLELTWSLGTANMI